MNWEAYLLEEYFSDYVDAQDKVTPFHYSWLLILISFVAWVELENY